MPPTDPPAAMSSQTTYIRRSYPSAVVTCKCTGGWGAYGPDRLLPATKAMLVLVVMVGGGGGVVLSRGGVSLISVFPFPSPIYPPARPLITHTHPRARAPLITPLLFFLTSGTVGVLTLLTISGQLQASQTHSSARGLELLVCGFIRSFSWSPFCARLNQFGTGCPPSCFASTRLENQIIAQYTQKMARPTALS